MELFRSAISFKSVNSATRLTSGVGTLCDRTDLRGRTSAIGGDPNRI
jgi:hypothetical protein